MPAEVFGRLDVLEPSARWAIEQLTATRTPAVQPEEQADKSWRLTLSNKNLAGLGNRLSNSMLLLGQLLIGLDRSAAPEERDPAVRVIMRGEKTKQIGDYHLEAQVAWATRVPPLSDTALADVASDVANSIATNVNQVITPRISLSRRAGVTILAREEPDEAGVRTGPGYRLPSPLEPATHKFVVRSFGLRVAHEPLICLGGLIAIAHPEDVQNVRPAI